MRNAGRRQEPNPQAMRFEVHMLTSKPTYPLRRVHYYPNNFLSVVAHLKTSRTSKHPVYPASSFLHHSQAYIIPVESIMEWKNDWQRLYPRWDFSWWVKDCSYCEDIEVNLKPRWWRLVSEYIQWNSSSCLCILKRSDNTDYVLFGWLFFPPRTAYILLNSF